MYQTGIVNTYMYAPVNNLNKRYVPSIPQFRSVCPHSATREFLLQVKCIIRPVSYCNWYHIRLYCNTLSWMMYDSRLQFTVNTKITAYFEMDEFVLDRGYLNTWPKMVAHGAFTGLNLPLSADVANTHELSAVMNLLTIPALYYPRPTSYHQ